MQACTYNSAYTLQVGPLHDSMACQQRPLCKSELSSSGCDIRTLFTPSAARATPDRWHRVSSPTNSSRSSSNRKTCAGRAGRDTDAKDRRNATGATRLLGLSDVDMTMYAPRRPTHALRNGRFLKMLPGGGTPLPPNRRNSCTACTSVDE